MSNNRIEEIKYFLKQNKKVYVSDLSNLYKVSEVTIRKYLTLIESQGYAIRFYGGAELVESPTPGKNIDSIYEDSHWIALARSACKQIQDGDSIFVGSGRSCCVLARELTGFNNLTVVTNNITALPDLIRNATKVYLIGGEVTTTDNQTLLSCWESPQSLLGNIYVNKAFTSVSGLDLKAGITVDSIISTYLFRNIPAMAHHWYLIVDSSKFDKIAIYPVAELSGIHAIISDDVPQKYQEFFEANDVQVINTTS